MSAAAPLRPGRTCARSPRSARSGGPSADEHGSQHRVAVACKEHSRAARPQEPAVTRERNYALTDAWDSSHAKASATDRDCCSTRETRERKSLLGELDRDRGRRRRLLSRQGPFTKRRARWGTNTRVSKTGQAAGLVLAGLLFWPSAGQARPEGASSERGRAVGARPKRQSGSFVSALACEEVRHRGAGELVAQ
jgi:hypothetical protein